MRGLLSPPRKGSDWLLSMIGLRPLLCMMCARRFFARLSLPLENVSHSELL